MTLSNEWNHPARPVFARICTKQKMAKQPGKKGETIMFSRIALMGLVLFTSSALAQDLPRVYIESTQAGDEKDRNWKKSGAVKHIDFGSAIAGAFVKKKVPVTVVTDKARSQWTIKTVSSLREDSTVTKVAKIGLLGVFAGSFTKFEGTFQVIDNESTAVLFAYNVKKNNFQSAADAFAKHFKKKFLKKWRKKRRN